MTDVVVGHHMQVPSDHTRTFRMFIDSASSLPTISLLSLALQIIISFVRDRPIGLIIVGYMYNKMSPAYNMLVPYILLALQCKFTSCKGEENTIINYQPFSL